MYNISSRRVLHIKCILVIVSMAVLGACGRVSLSIADAPVDSAEALVLAFSGVDLRAVSGDTVKVEFKDNKRIDILRLTDGISEALLSEEVLLEDKYDRITLSIDVDESFVTIDGADYSLVIPADAQSGLHIDKEFEVIVGTDRLFTIDFDVRKSLFEPQSGTDEYILRPVLRMVDNTISGSITGIVDASLLSIDADCFDNSGAVTAVAYVFDGADINPDDIDGDGLEPVTSARVKADLTYTAAFLEEGDYTVSLTCEAINDDPASNDAINFLRNETVTVIKEQSVLANFAL